MRISVATDNFVSGKMDEVLLAFIRCYSCLHCQRISERPQLNTKPCALPWWFPKRDHWPAEQNLLGARGRCGLSVHPWASELGALGLKTARFLHVVSVASRVRLSGSPWSVSCQAPLSTGFSRREHRSGLSFPSLRNLPDPGIQPRSPALQADSLPNESPPPDKYDAI